MNRDEVRARIAEVGIVPAIRAASREDAVYAVESVESGGIPNKGFTRPSLTEQGYRLSCFFLFSWKTSNPFGRRGGLLQGS